LLGSIYGTLEGYGSLPLSKFYFALSRLTVCHVLDFISNNQIRGEGGDLRELFVNSLILIKNRFLQFVRDVTLTRFRSFFLFAESADQLIPSRSDFGLMILGCFGFSVLG
jgi:hypothetical protein